MNKKIIIIIMASVVALAVIIAGVIVMLSSGFSFTNPENPSSEQQSTQSDTLSDTEKSDNDVNNSESNSQTGSSEGKAESNLNSNVASENVPDEPAFYIANTSGTTGETVKVPVKVTKNPGFIAFLINFEYDAKALKYKGYEAGDVLSDYEIEDNNGTIKFMSVENGDVTKDGTLVYLEFEVLDGASGKSEIKINIPEKSIANFNEEYVHLASQNGYIEIK